MKVLMQDTAYEEAWGEDEDKASKTKPIESAVSKAARAARDKEAKEFSDAFNSEEPAAEKVDA